MAKPGPKPKRDNVEWSPRVAYGVGLFTTDGCLSIDGRHLDFTSKDIEQLENFKKCFDLDTKISYKTSGFTDKKYPRLQFSDVGLYRFFESIGLEPAKTKTIGVIDIPKKYYFHFLRGHLDGDGCFYSYWDKRWKSSYMFYLTFSAYSEPHIVWIRKALKDRLGVSGHLSKPSKKRIFELKYAKKESMKILEKMYHDKDVICLSRKRLKIEKALGIMGKQLP
jgi:intein-encoded DNA endonuclease-like protein